MDGAMYAAGGMGAAGVCSPCPACYGVISSGALVLLGATLLLMALSILVLLMAGAALVAWNWSTVHSMLLAASSGKQQPPTGSSPVLVPSSKAPETGVEQFRGSVDHVERSHMNAPSFSRPLHSEQKAVLQRQPSGAAGRGASAFGSFDRPRPAAPPPNPHPPVPVASHPYTSPSSSYGPHRSGRMDPGDPTLLDRTPSFDRDSSIEQQRAALHAKAMALIADANSNTQMRDSHSSLGSLPNPFTPKRDTSAERTLDKVEPPARRAVPKEREQPVEKKEPQPPSAPEPPKSEPMGMERQESDSQPSLGDVPMELLEGILNKGPGNTLSVDVSHNDGFIGTLALDEQLGGGAFGQVFLCQWDGAQAAVKLIEMVIEPAGSTDAIETFLAEAEVAALLRHPNIVQVYKVNIERMPQSMDEHSMRTGRLTYRGAIVMEYCEMGTLADAMKDNFFTVVRDGQTLVDLQLLLNVAEDVARGMMFLHSQEVLHADLKPNNVLLKEVGNGIVAKLTDFGLSVQMTCSQTHVSQHQTGTLDHMAPEVMMEGKTSKRSDVYSFGILLWELFCFSRPYVGMRDVAIVHKVVEQDLRPVFPRTAPREYVALATACWEKDPQKRPDFAEISRRVQNMSTVLNKLLTTQGPDFKLVESGEVPPPETASGGHNSQTMPLNNTLAALEETGSVGDTA